MTLDQIKQANKASGSHWFSPATRRFFSSRISDIIYQGPGGIYFVSSERCWGRHRSYTINQFDPTTSQINTLGTFQQYTNRRSAHKAAAKASKG